MNNISFDLYNLFYVVASAGSISRAAEELYISQPAVTQSIRKLEMQLGGTLFYRVPKGVVLTEEGKKLYCYMKESIETIENAEKKFSQYINLEEGTIRIRCGNTFGVSILYNAILQFSNMFPKINIEVSNGLAFDSINGLSKGKYDIVIFKDSNQELPTNVEKIEGPEDQLCFYATPEYLKENPINKYQDLENCNLILTTKNSNTGKVLSEFAEKNGLKISARYEISNSEARKHFAKNGMGIAIGQESLIKNEIADGTLIKLDLKPDLPKIKASIAILKGEISSFATLKFVDFLRDEFEE
ncbi:MAG: LysR family transcriptional regulator [Clostridia bacterium]|nr:LysR family transcriptional regulator [Clostridia bacterium]